MITYLRRLRSLRKHRASRLVCDHDYWHMLVGESMRALCVGSASMLGLRAVPAPRDLAPRLSSSLSFWT